MRETVANQIDFPDKPHIEKRQGNFSGPCGSVRHSVSEVGIKDGTAGIIRAVEGANPTTGLWRFGLRRAFLFREHCKVFLSI